MTHYLVVIITPLYVELVCGCLSITEPANEFTSEFTSEFNHG